ncbi:hypothetical protein KC315_g487 [Hortaea werneckii]|nr:hypothetical protein KC315_g487 [Hortaea werneckii]
MVRAHVTAIEGLRSCHVTGMDSDMLWDPADINASTKDLMASLCDVAMEPRNSDFTVVNMTATQETQDSRPLSLSPELRNIIYEEVLVLNNNIEIPWDGRLVRPPLLKVCRQVAEEASTIFYGLNRFTSTNNSLEYLPLWCARMPLKSMRSIKVIDLCYETDTEVDNVVHELHPEMILDVEARERKCHECFGRRRVSANEKFQNTVMHMALLGLDLSAFRLPPMPPLLAPDPYLFQMYQIDSALFARKEAEWRVRILKRAWIRSGNSSIPFHQGRDTSRYFRECKEHEEWLRKMAADTKTENIMARAPEIIILIQG